MEKGQIKASYRQNRLSLSLGWALLGGLGWFIGGLLFHMFGGWDSSWRIALAEAVPITLALVPTEYIAFAIVPESTGFPNQLSLKVGFMFASLIVIAKTGADLMTPVRAYLGHLLGVG